MTPLFYALLGLLGLAFCCAFAFKMADRRIDHAVERSINRHQQRLDMVISFRMKVRDISVACTNRLRKEGVEYLPPLHYYFELPDLETMMKEKCPLRLESYFSGTDLARLSYTQDHSELW